MLLKRSRNAVTTVEYPSFGLLSSLDRLFVPSPITPLGGPCARPTVWSDGKFLGNTIPGGSYNLAGRVPRLSF